MSPEVLILMIAAGVYILYKVMSFFYFLWLRSKLKGKHIRDFQKVLGYQYLERQMYTGIKRCKWKKLLIVVKANFDYEGNLRHVDRVPFSIFKLRSEILFT